MFYVYFLFAGYRVAIGRTKNLYNRLTVYRRTHHDVFILGIIKCDSKEKSIAIEKDMLYRFHPHNAFRDMFYLTAEIRDWIAQNTTEVKDDDYRGQERKYKRDYDRMRRKDTEYRNRNSERKRNRYQHDPNYREYIKKYNRDRYKNDAQYRERQRDHYRNHNAKRRKKRPVSEGTLKIPF